MKICEIINEARNDQVLGYLFYFEKSSVYSIELSDRPDTEDFPLFLLSFVKRNKMTVDPDWSRRWAEDRIVPSDRQNLGMILRENGLKGYDSFRLLMLGKGRCAQDDCALRPVKETGLPEWIRERFMKKVSFAVYLGKYRILAGFANGTLRIIPMKGISEDPEIFPGGLGIKANRSGFIPAEKLYEQGSLLAFDRTELNTLIKNYILDTPEVCELLHCSRQYVDQLMRKNEIEVIKATGNNRLYSRSSILSLVLK